MLEQVEWDQDILQEILPAPHFDIFIWPTDAEGAG